MLEGHPRAQSHHLCREVRPREGGCITIARYWRVFIFFHLILFFKLWHYRSHLRRELTDSGDTGPPTCGPALDFYGLIARLKIKFRTHFP